MLIKNNVKLIGIGFEHLGAKEFIDGKFFEGVIWIDELMEIYEILEFRKIGYLQFLPSLISSKARAAQEKANSLRLGGTLIGNIQDKHIWKNGGCLIVENGGGAKPLFHYIQQDASDHVPNSDVLKALEITEEAPAATPVISKIV